MVKHSVFVCIMMEAYVIGGLGVKCSVDSRPLFSVLFFNAYLCLYIFFVSGVKVYVCFPLFAECSFSAANDTVQGTTRGKSNKENKKPGCILGCESCIN